MSANVPFRTIPSGLRLPGSYFELDNSQANTAQGNQRALIIGQITSAGIATPNVPIISAGTGDANLQGGASSQLANMVAAYRLNDSFGEVWTLPLADATGATAASGSIAFLTTPTAAGTIALYIAGLVVNVPVTIGETVAAIATAVAAAINLIPQMPVTAAAAAGVVTLTADNKGLCGNEIDIRFNYYGTAGGEATPAGLTFTVTPMASGATNPTLTTALGNLGNMTFDFIATPYTDTASLGGGAAIAERHDRAVELVATVVRPRVRRLRRNVRESDDARTHAEQSARVDHGLQRQPDAELALGSIVVRANGGQRASRPGRSAAKSAARRRAGTTQPVAVPAEPARDAFVRWNLDVHGRTGRHCDDGKRNHELSTERPGCARQQLFGSRDDVPADAGDSHASGYVVVEVPAVQTCRQWGLGRRQIRVS